MSKKKKSAPDTTKKGGKAPPDVSFDYVVKDLLDYFKGFKGLQDTENEIEKKYNIDKNKTKNKNKNKNKNENDWNEDDVKKAWGKTQRMYKYSGRRKTWSLAIILHAISHITRNKTNCSCEKTADINVGPNAGTERSLQIPEITQNNTKKRSYRDFPKDDDITMDEPTKRSCVAIKVESNAATESQYFTCENTPNTNEEPNADREIQRLTREMKKIAIEYKEMCGTRTTITSRKSGSYADFQTGSDADSQTVYIRIPLSFMDVSENTICPKAEKKRYKLTDGVPSFPSFIQTMKTTSYVVQYDNRTKNAAWVFEILNKKTLSEREDFEKTKRRDINIPQLMLESDKIKYHKGHLAAAANHKWSQKAMDDTFLLCNIVPQNGDLNTNDWKNLEEKCRGYATKHRNVYVYTGPLYLPPENSSKITYKYCGIKAVPTHLFKVIILEKLDGTLDVECNIAANDVLQTCIPCQLDDIESWSGMVFSEKSQFVSNEESGVKVQWSAQETGETHSIDTTFTITPSQDSKEQLF